MKHTKNFDLIISFSAMGGKVTCCGMKQKDQSGANLIPEVLATKKPPIDDNNIMKLVLIFHLVYHSLSDRSGGCHFQV